MDPQAPAVVAVMVTTDPGPWFEETLLSLARQDYQELSVLVLATGDGPDPSERVGRILPDAFVRRLPGHPGYAAAANAALDMVEGAAFFLLCHHDCALDHDVVHTLVEESFRSNAGVVSPKFVNWDDPTILLHVGMSCDKTGAVVDRIQDGEVDHGQHDAVRDVFVAPSGCTLIRADLWRELGGFDAGIVAMGEDLDLSWRSQVAGSRVVVAPDARVRHLGVVASGSEPLPTWTAEGERPVTLQGLQRRHELRAVLKCYGWFHLLRVLPQAALLAFFEVIVALLARDRLRARAVAGAWTWNAHHWAELRTRRAELKAHRLFPDAEVRRLQLRGSARLSRYFSRLSHQGLSAANAVRLSGQEASPPRQVPEVAVLTGSVGLAFSEDSDFDDLDDLGHRSGRDRFGRKVRRAPLASGRSRTVAILVAALVILLGTRELLFGSLPLVGQLAPLAGWAAGWHHFFSGWQPAGAGTTAPATPAFGLVSLVGTVLLGSMGLAQRILILGCIPVGAIGFSRLMLPLVSARARVVATICYLGLPLPYAALGSGRWDGLVAYAALPLIVLRLARTAEVAPFTAVAGRGWRSTELGQVALLGAIIGIATSFAPAVLPMTLVCALAFVVGSAVTGTADLAFRVVWVAVKAVGMAALLAAPWVIGTLAAGSHAVDIFGLPISASNAPNWGEVIRFAVGPTARSPIVWLLVAASALPLLLGRGLRLIWAARFWALACLSWVLAYAATHGWTGAFTPSETVVLVPAAIAVAAGVGLGLASFESDVAGAAFGWRQLISGVAMIAVILGMLPVALGAFDGRWGLPANGVEQPLAFLNRPDATTAYRVLWLGDPRALPVGGWPVDAGLSYSLTGQSLPDATAVWTPAGPGPADTAATGVRLALQGNTVHLGRLLAPLGVRYVVIIDGINPGSSEVASVNAPPPVGLQRALLNQDDLQVVPGQVGVQVYQNTESLPVTAQRAQPLPAGPRWSFPTALDVLGWRPVLTPLGQHHAATGAIARGTVYAAYAPAGDFSLAVGGQARSSRPAFGWAGQYPGTPAGPATLAFHRLPFVPLIVLVELAGWLVLAASFLEWRRRTRVAPPEQEAP